MIQSHQLSADQRDAVEWIAREALEMGWERDLAPADAMTEARSLLLLAELSGSEELVEFGNELVTRAQGWLDALPKPPTVGVTFDIGGHADGEQYSNLKVASERIGEWVANLDPDGLTGVDVRVSIEILKQEASQ